MIKGRVIVIIALCFTAATISGTPVGMVHEFQIDSPSKSITKHETQKTNQFVNAQETTEKKTNTENNHLTNNDKLNHIESVYTDSDLEETIDNKNLLANNKIEPNHADSIYTASDLEETASKDILDGPNTEEREAVHTNTDNTRTGNNRKEEVSSVYTESDLEATTSRDVKKNEVNRDKHSVGGDLVVVHKRDIRDAGLEGSGEGSGSGQLPPDV